MESTLQTLSSDSQAADASDVLVISNGNARAFEHIMRRYNQRLYRLAVGILLDASEAQDVLQESYVKAFYLLSSLNSSSNIGPWLARIVRNEAIDRLRARTARHKRFPLAADLSQPHDDAENHDGFEIESHANENVSMFDPETLVARARLTDVLEQAIRSLPEQFRTVFILREVEGLSIKEVAEYLSIPPATVKTRDHRARALLQARLNKRIDAATKDAFAFMGTRCDAIVCAVFAQLQFALH